MGLLALPGPSVDAEHCRERVVFTTACTSTMVRPLSDPELVDLLVESRARRDRIAMDVRHAQVTNVRSGIAARRRRAGRPRTPSLRGPAPGAADRRPPRGCPGDHPQRSRPRAHDEQAYLRCRVCRSHDEPTPDAYPCATVKHGLWALEATGPR